MLHRLLMSGQRKLVASGSIAAGDNKLDYTADNSFIEFGVDLSPYHGNHRIVVTDSAGKSASGFLHSVAPGGYTIGDELVTDGDMSVPASWSIIPPASIAGGVATFGAEGSITQGFVGEIPVGAMAQVVYTIGTVNETGIKLNTGATRIFYSSAGFRTTNATFTEYLPVFYTPGSVAFYGSSSNGTLDDVSLKRITDCAATGALIVSTLGGSTRSWTSVDEGFNPNLECEYKIYRVR